MRSTIARCALLPVAALLLAGCSPSSRTEPSDADSAQANPVPRSWASEEKASETSAAPGQPGPLPDAFSSSPPSFAPLTPSGDPLKPRQPVAVPGEPPLESSPVEPSVSQGDHLVPPPPVDSGTPDATPSEGTIPFSVSDNPLRVGDSASSESGATRPTPLPTPTFPPPPTGPPTGDVMTPAAPIESATAESPAASLPPVDPPAASFAGSADLPDSGAVPSANPKSGGKTADPDFDPIKENGPIFVGWTKPKLAVVITGREDGYIEPCGCAGLDKMKGGLSRRHTMIESLREKGWPVVAVDVGGFTKGYGRQTEIKFQSTIEAMRKMEYDAIGFGANDLRLPAGELVSVAAEPSPFVSANVGLFGFDANLTAQTKIVDVNGLKVGVTAVLGKTHQGDLNNQEIELAAPEEAIARVLPELKKKCNLLVLLAHATKDEAIALGEKFPEFQIVVTAGGPAEPPSEPLRFPVDEPRSLLIEVGEKGMNAVVLGFYDDPRQPVRYQRVPLDSRFKASRDMYRIM
ncbi:MAG: hypothetical protein GX621_03285, partial [Pirellulaceae bacterium]|nr:hypothetical protein [Pirellulaceae bacterium]